MPLFFMRQKMIKKFLFLVSFILVNDALIASNAPEAGEAPVKTQTFAYEKEIFSLHMTSNVDQDTPSLAGLYQDALARKTHLDALFNHVRANKFNKVKNNALIEHVNYRHKILSNFGFSDRPQDLRIIHLLKIEYVVERDLVDCFLQILERFAQTPPSQKQIQEFYQQVAYACRMNLSSLQANLFHELAYTYPKFYWLGQDGESQYQDGDFTAYHNDEDRAYADLLKQFPNGANTETLDTIAITKIARHGMHPLVTFTKPDIILELNSLFFYLNIERALLSACPDLVFNPADYAFRKDLVSQNNTFALSRIADYHRQGTFYALMKATKPVERQFPTYLKMKDRLLESTLNNRAQEPIDFFLNKLFPVEPIKKIQTPRAIKSKPAQTNPPKSTNTRPKKLVQAEEEITGTKAPKGIDLLDLRSLQDAFHEDDYLATPEELEEIDNLIEMAASSTPTATPTVLSITPYRPRVHVDSYAYKRCVSTSTNGSYLFMDQPFSMIGSFFEVDTLRQIKFLTHHEPDNLNIQNLSSYQLRFHFQHEDGKHNFVDFTSKHQYLSGGRRMDAANRHAYRLKMAFHDYLTPVQAKSYLLKEKIEKRPFLLSNLSNQLNECAVQGPWHHNCADSEALMILDLQKQMPAFLKEFAPSTGEKITLLGAVLGASSYHDVCWRCRNLFQGWQWGLDDTITHWKDAYHLPITLSPDFSTIVFGFGEVAPQAHNFFPSKPSTQMTILGTSKTQPKERHKLKIVSLNKETT